MSPHLTVPPLVLAEKIGLDLNREARIFCCPSLWEVMLGGSITAGILSTPMLKNDQRYLAFYSMPVQMENLSSGTWIG